MAKRQNVDVYEDPFAETGPPSSATKDRKKVVKLLSPIPGPAHIYGVGLNYKGHAAEANVSLARSSDCWSCVMEPGGD
jgi:2-keto-4-pentenoate hydratase/2-oxohepta-3-ene-1,7-dioic acid hydratase in catechol pathway